MDANKSVSEEGTTPKNTTNDNPGHDANGPTPAPFPLSPPNAPSPNEATQNEDVIRSPLDQRSYKSITLPNGVKVMLISTREVEYFAYEQDATAPLCQVPEVAEFNKKYLGYDNPAARVKCACPCGETKTCCGQSANPQKAIAENILEEDEPSEMIPAQSDNPPVVNLLAGAPIIDAEKHERNKRHMIRHGKQIIPLSEAPQSCCGTCQCCQPRNKPEDTNLSPTAVNASSDELETESLPNTKNRRPSRHYPFPPKFVEGLQTIRTCPTGGTGCSRPKTNRPHLNTDFTFDLEGTVYLVIGSGYFDDPDDQPGLAHFCEHAVFLGSEVFPEPNQLFKLVLPYDGYVNAYTSGMSTTFTTSASYKLFPLAVEILADMVGFPLFPHDLVAAELEALDSEYSLRQDDTPKYFQLIGSLAKKGHVIRKMDSGNISTIRVPNYYRKLIEWRRIFYSPNRMTLAFEAPFPLDYLEKLAMETFGRIPVGHVTIPNRISLSPPFDMKKFHQIYHVHSVHHSEFIALHWALDPKAWKNLKVKPLEYLGAIISQKAEGGLVHYLTSKGLATNVDAGCWESDVTRNHFTSLFSISVDLTEKGFKKQDNILQAIFGYIEMLIREGPKKTFFHELQKQQLESFHYKGAESSQSLAESVSRWMQFIPPKWCLISPILTCEFDEELIKKCTEALTVESANLIVFSKNYGGAEEVGGRGMEEFYNTPFSSFDFPVELQETLKHTKNEYSHKFIFPPPNPFLLNTACRRSPEQDLLRKGCLYKVKGKLTVSYMSRKVQLVTGLLPQARYSIWIGSPLTSYLGAPEGSTTRLHIFSQYLNALFETKFYHASNADLELGTEVSQGELHILFAGAHVMLPCLFEQVLKLINDFENVIDQTGFDVVRSAFIETLDNTILDNRFLAWDLYYYLWTNNHELIFDHRRHAQELTFSSFLSFVKSFKTKMYIQAHLYGYITNAQGELIVNALGNLLYEPVDLREYLLLRCMRQKLGERIIKVNSQNPSIHTSVVINSYQFGMLTEPEEDALNFFAKTMSDAAFYQLRTEQQLGYIIIIYAEVTFGVSSIVVELVTQPKNFTTEHCNECIDNFLLDFYMENLAAPESYQEFCRGKPKLDLSFESITELFQTYLLPNPFHYRKLSVQVVGTIEDGLSHPTEPPEDIQLTTYSGAAGYNISNNNEEFPDEGALKIHQTTSIRAKSTILQVTSFKKSLQVRDGNNMSSRRPNKGKKIKSVHGKSNVCTRVVKDLGKFKKSLTYFPTMD